MFNNLRNRKNQFNRNRTTGSQIMRCLPTNRMCSNLCNRKKLFSHKQRSQNSSIARCNIPGRAPKVIQLNHSLKNKVINDTITGALPEISGGAFYDQIVFLTALFTGLLTGIRVLNTSKSGSNFNIRNTLGY